MIARAPSTAAHPEPVEGHGDAPAEDGCIFAAALIVVLALILITPALLP